MAISCLGFACRPHFSLRLPLLYCVSLRVSKLRLSSVAAVEAFEEPEFLTPIKDTGEINSVHGIGKSGDWKRLNSEELGIRTSMIPKSTRKVLNGLKRNGYEAYLVGGCVRDFILKRTPKDFDIITSAELKQVIRAFSCCEIVGKRFPICHVHIDDTIVEVSSFSTSGRKFEKDLSDDFNRPAGCDEKDYIRWKNCLQRDFTINGLIFDPYSRIVYDYTGGIEDIKKAKVRTVIPASSSFQEDCARILRAIRIAARLGFRFSRETAHFVKHLACSILRLDKAAYFIHHGFQRRDKRSNMLVSLFSNMDKLLAPDRPCHSSLWVGILAFHIALSEQPMDPVVVAAFGLAVHNGGDILEAVKIAMKITTPHAVIFHELSEQQNLDSQALTDAVMDLTASVKRALIKMTDEQFVSQAMEGYPEAPYSDLVLIPLGLYLRVCRIFECVSEGGEKGFVAKQGSKIDYELLALGGLQEVRHVFARIVFDTVYPIRLN